MLLAFAQLQIHLAIYSFTTLFFVPVGAIASGYVAASGYYLGSRLFHRAPTHLLAFNVVACSIGTFFYLQYMIYRGLQINGLAVLHVMPFPHFLHLVVTAQIGALGYLLVGLYIVGFAIGGLHVYKSLRARSYCGQCQRYARREFSFQGYEMSADRIQDAYSKADRNLAQGDIEGAKRSVAVLRKEEPAAYQLLLHTSRCTGCRDLLVRLALNFNDSKKWVYLEPFESKWRLPQDGPVTRTIAAKSATA